MDRSRWKKLINKDWMMFRMVGGWVFLLVPAHPDSPRQRAIKRLLFLWVCNYSPNSVSTKLQVHSETEYYSDLQKWWRTPSNFTQRPHRRCTCTVQSYSSHSANAHPI